MSRTISFKQFVLLQRGFDLPNSSRKDGDVPVVASTGISGYHNEYKVSAPGVVTGRSGSLGTVQYIEKKFWPLNTSLWVKDFKGNLPRYVYYYLQTMGLEKYNSGAGVPTLNRNDLDTIDIKVHDFHEQRKIATTLSAYDNLIENNNRRIAILEEMIKKLYREWFLIFRFPGHENVKMVESEQGLIPEGWATVQLKELCTKIFSGGTPTTTVEEYWNGDLPWLSSGETRDGYITSTEKTITSKGAQNSSTRYACKFDVVVASAGQGKTRGQTSLLLLDTYINQSVIAISATESYRTYVYYNIKGRYDELRHLSDSSSIRGSLTVQIFNSLKIVKPSEDLAKLFQQFTLPYINQIELLILKNINLRRTRDLLLPRLISGDIDVSELDIPIKEG